jgi:hypothetical protein
MRKMNLVVATLLSLTAVLLPAGIAQGPPETRSADVPKVLDRYRSVRPEASALPIFQLDWAPTLKEARDKAAKEQRPVLLLVVTNSYGNLYTGHC